MSRFALRLFLRDWRTGELTILTLSLIVAISTMTSIGLFTDRIKHSINEQASYVLAADAQVRGNALPDDAWVKQAHEQGLQTAMATSISVMAFSGDLMRLGSVKAVSSLYPLKGELVIADQPFAEQGEIVEHGPPAGEVWINSSLFSALDLKMGDSFEIGDSSFKVTAALMKEPDMSMGALFSGARILMNSADLESTGTIQTGSRVRYHWMLEGSNEDIEAFKDWLEPELGVHFWWRSAEQSSENMSATVERAQSFLLLAGSLSVILAGVAVALAARRYAFRQRRGVALLKTLGLTPKKITSIYMYYLLFVGLIACVIGMFIGWALHLGILYLLKDMLPANLEPASIKAYWSGGVSGFVALLAFAGPPLLALRRIPPIAVMRDAVDSNSGAVVWNSVVGVVAILGLVYWYSQSAMITGVLFITLSVCVVGVSGLAWVLVSVSKIAGKSMSGYWRLGFASLHRHRQFNIFQIMIFSILLMLLFVLTLVRTSLISDWQEQSLDGLPNYFLYNVFADDKDALAVLFAENNVSTEPFYPMVRGRIVSLNGTEYKWQKDDPTERNRFARELNLTWTTELSKNNEIVEGLWWDELEPQKIAAGNEEKKNVNLVSIEKSFADTLDLAIGDKIVMSITGVEFMAEVASIRTLDWNARTPNFYMIFQRPVQDGEGANWMTSFYLPGDDVEFANTLMRNFPTVTLLALEQIIVQINGVIAQVSLAVEFILVLVLIAGLLVLVTGIQATLDERLKESAILRTLGANRKMVHRSLLVEFSGMGLVAGILATLGAEACLFMLQANIFSMSFQPAWSLLIIGPLSGAFLIAFIGWLSTRNVTQTPPLIILRGLDSRA